MTVYSFRSGRHMEVRRILERSTKAFGTLDEPLRARVNYALKLDWPFSPHSPPLLHPTYSIPPTPLISSPPQPSDCKQYTKHITLYRYTCPQNFFHKTDDATYRYGLFSIPCLHCKETCDPDVHLVRGKRWMCWACGRDNCTFWHKVCDYSEYPRDSACEVRWEDRWLNDRAVVLL